MSHLPTHKHRCPKCAYVWEHETPHPIEMIFGFISEDEYAERHTCPNCEYRSVDRADEEMGTYFKYFGDVPAGEFDTEFADGLTTTVITLGVK